MPRNHITHGLSNTRLYRCWRDMRNRCNGLKKNDRKNYFERGITVCDEWKNDFIAFYNWSISHGYRDDLTIDRIDNDKGYSPENCRWVSRAVQNNNTRQNRYISYNGEIHTITEWSKILGINKNTIVSRLDLYGWSVDEAFNTRILKGGETRCNISS